MTRLVLLLVAVMAVSYVCAEKAKRCQIDAECKGQGKANRCVKSLCLQSCKSNSECASGDCEHEGIRIFSGGFCKVDRGGECLASLTCESGKECEHGYCIPK